MANASLFDKLPGKRRIAVDWKIDQQTGGAPLSKDVRSERREEIASAPAVVTAIVKEHEIHVRETWRNHRRLLAAASGTPESISDLSSNAYAAVNDEVGRLAAEWLNHPENCPTELGGFIDFTVQSLICDPDRIATITKAWEANKGLADTALTSKSDVPRLGG